MLSTTATASVATAATTSTLHSTYLVKTSIKIPKGKNTRHDRRDLVADTMAALRAQLMLHGQHPSSDQIEGLQDAVSTLKEMAQGRCSPAVYLSSLDPGVGKTTAIVCFIQQLMASRDHEDVGVLLCLPRIAEIDRVVVELGLDDSDFAVFTSDQEANKWTSTPPNHARVLITTHAMLWSRCRGRQFGQMQAFHYQGCVREVRIWDEAMLPGEVVTVSTDDLGSLLKPLRKFFPVLADLIQDLQGELGRQKPDALMDWPDLHACFGRHGTPSVSSLAGMLTQEQGKALERTIWLSGRTIRVAKENGKVRSALDIRDALPDDFSPVLVLDASGRVRSTYKLWSSLRGGLVQLKTAPKNYSRLTIHVLDQGGGKDAWRHNDDQFLSEVASVIEQRPSEPWLIVHHWEIGRERFERRLKERGCRPTRIEFLTWGSHQGTNAFADVPNVILAGTLFMPHGHYQGLAFASAGLAVHSDLPPDLVDVVQQGEHCDLVLQALCRGHARGNDGTRCRPSNAYIIASKGSGIRTSLPKVFPGCRVVDWQPQHKPPRGKVAEAIAYLEKRLSHCPEDTISFTELMRKLEIPDKSNFNRTIRKHPDFKRAMERLGLVEVEAEGAKIPNALQRLFLAD